MISRGQIYLVNLDPVQGREQKGWILALGWQRRWARSKRP
jgi:mRNA-degrading endonuclease toxin of MazEF toxin-antitoxin module